LFLPGHGVIVGVGVGVGFVGIMYLPNVISLAETEVDSNSADAATQRRRADLRYTIVELESWEKCREVLGWKWTRENLVELFGRLRLGCRREDCNVRMYGS
jgi:hypothetical protein